jgi:4'-phosphopantetheinyl transferase
MKEGKIILQRKKDKDEAGFCIIKAPLSVLLTYTNLLSPQEQIYFNTLSFERRRQSYLLGRIAAKYAICQLITSETCQSVSINAGVFQFPVVQTSGNHNVQVSITHCGDIGIAVAFPEAHPLAVDIEEVDLNRLELMKSQLAGEELERIHNCGLSLATGCTLLWSVKEALSKVIKTGLTLDFKLLETDSMVKEGHLYHGSFRHFIQYRSVSFQAGNFIFSIVLPKNTSTDIGSFTESLLTVVEK